MAEVIRGNPFDSGFSRGAADSWAQDRSLSPIALAVSRIQRAARSPVNPEAVMANPPAITVATGASPLNGSTASVGAQDYLPVDEGTTQLSGRLIEATAGEYKAGGVTNVGSSVGYRGPDGTGFSIATTAPDFEAAVKIQNGSAIVAYVTEDGVRARVSAAASTAADANPKWYRLTGMSTKPKLIELYIGGLDVIRGFNVTSGHAIWEQARPEPRIAFLGDSYFGDQGSVDGIRYALPYLIAANLGITNPWNGGNPGTGWLNPAGTNGTYLQRIQNGDFAKSFCGALDMIVVNGSVNDDASYNAPWTDAAFTAAFQTGMEILAEEQPEAIIVVAPPQNTVTTPLPASRVTAMKATFDTLRAADKTPGRWIWRDSSPAGENWLDTERDAARFDGGGIHFNALADLRYYAARFSTSILRGLYERFGAIG